MYHSWDWLRFSPNVDHDRYANVSEVKFVAAAGR
jgi:hypothetical protein